MCSFRPVLAKGEAREGSRATRFVGMGRPPVGRLPCSRFPVDPKLDQVAPLGLLPVDRCKSLFLGAYVTVPDNLGGSRRCRGSRVLHGHMHRRAPPLQGLPAGPCSKGAHLPPPRVPGGTLPTHLPNGALQAVTPGSGGWAGGSDVKNSVEFMLEKNFREIWKRMEASKLSTGILAL